MFTTPVVFSPEQIADEVLALAQANSSLEAVFKFHNWILRLQREAFASSTWFSFAPVLKACLRLKSRGGVLGFALIRHAEAIPRELRSVVLHSFSPSNEFPVEGFYVYAIIGDSCWDLHAEAEHCEAEEDELQVTISAQFNMRTSRSIQVTSEGHLVFPYEDTLGREFVLQTNDYAMADHEVTLRAKSPEEHAADAWEIGFASLPIKTEENGYQLAFQLRSVAGADRFLSIQECGFESDSMSQHACVRLRMESILQYATIESRTTNHDAPWR